MFKAGKYILFIWNQIIKNQSPNSTVFKFIVITYYLPGHSSSFTKKFHQ